MGELRSLYGWPAPEDPDGSRDEELAGRELIADRLVDEVRWLRDCAAWLEQLELARARTVADLEYAQIDPDVRAERRRRLAESPLAFAAHGRSIRQYRQALYEFEKERWRRGETDSHPLYGGIYRRKAGLATPRAARHQCWCSPKRTA